MLPWLNVSLSVGGPVLQQTANNRLLACMVMCSASLGCWDICIHILESGTFTWDMLFSFVLIVGHFLSPILKFLVALASAYLLHNAGLPSRPLSIESASSCQVYNTLQHGLVEHRLVNLGCVLLVNPLVSVGATSTTGGSSARATAGITSTCTTCNR